MEKFYQGTKQFSPGTKVYIGQAYWGAGGDQLHIIGLRRISRKFVNCVVRVDVLTNLRTCSIYSAKIWETLQSRKAMLFENQEDALEYQTYITAGLRRDLPDKLKPETKQSPWGEYTAERYRKDKKYL